MGISLLFFRPRTGLVCNRHALRYIIYRIDTQYKYSMDKNFIYDLIKFKFRSLYAAIEEEILRSKVKFKKINAG
jgi:hypothetical protein